MRPLRYIAAAAIVTICILSTVLYMGCSKNKCGSTSCQNSGTCSGDVCVCPTGYSGKTCGTGWNDIFIGTYNCSRSSCSPAVSGDTTWISAITRSTDGATVSISNFDNSNRTITATVDTFQHISVRSAPPAYGVIANGTYTSGRIALSFTTSASGSLGGYSCNMVMRKQ